MRRAMSTLIYARRERLHPGLLDQMVSGGAEAIEIFAARGHFNYTDRQHVRQIANWFRSTGVTFHSMHSPMHPDEDWGRGGATHLNIASVEKLQRVDATDEIKRAIEVAEQAPFQYLVQHVGIGHEEADEHKLDAAMSSLEHLHAFAKPLGVQLLVENITNELSTPEKLMELLHAGRFDDIGVCFDVGHAHIMSSVPQAFEVLKDRVFTTMTRITICISGPAKAASIGSRRWNCCGPRPTHRPCCWRLRVLKARRLRRKWRRRSVSWRRRYEGAQH